MARYVVAKGHRLRLADGLFLEAGAMYECSEADAARMGEALVPFAGPSVKDGAASASAISDRMQRILDRLAPSLDPDEWEAVTTALEKVARRRISAATAPSWAAGVGERSAALAKAITPAVAPPAPEAPAPAADEEAGDEDEADAPRVVLDEPAAPAVGAGNAPAAPAKATRPRKGGAT